MAAPRNGRNVVSRTMSICVGHYEPFTKVFSPNVEGVVADQVVLRCSICRSVPEIFAMKVVRNRTEIWTFFSPRKFWRRTFQKLYTRYHPCLAARRLEKFREDADTSPEVIEAHTLNFKPNFKFSQLKFLGGDPVPAWVCAR